MSGGTAPDWLAAIGTVGTLGLGLHILLGDRRRQKREQAAHVAVWERGGRVPLLSGEILDRGPYVVTFHNQSQQPVTQPLLVARAISPRELEDRLGHRAIPNDWLDKRSPLARLGAAGRIAFADSFKDVDGAELTHVPPGASIEHSVALPLPRSCYDVDISFRDAYGHPWRREVASGRLDSDQERPIRRAVQWIRSTLKAVGSIFQGH